MAVSMSFWNCLQNLCAYQKVQLVELQEHQAELNVQSEADERNQAALCISQIERITLEVMQSLKAGNSPVLRIPKKHKSSNSVAQLAGEELVSLGKAKQTGRFAQLFDVLSKSYVLLQSNRYATLRDVYYENVALYVSQPTLDRTVEDISRLLDVPRRSLHITATSKGLLVGNLTFFTHDSSLINVTASNEGLAVPNYVDGLHSFVSDARFILVIEKDATFQNLIQSQFVRAFGPCILITGKGYPDLCTRQMLRRLWIELKIPVLALVDADPYGLHIAAVYKFGALARDDPNLIVSGLALLGILPSDLRGLQLPEQSLLPLSPRDYGKLASLNAHPSIRKNEAWLQQIQCLQELGKKAEIQSLTQISQEFLTSVYLPTKISSAGWIL